MRISTKMVDTPAYHVWTDALHARELARKARDRWNRGTYVRWTIKDAWTAFETSCEEALNTSGLGYDFKRRVDDAVAALRLQPLDWGRGLWQRALKIYGLRKDYVHPRIPQPRLWAPLNEAEDAIQILREAIKEIYRHAGKSQPGWADVDEDVGRPRSVAHAMVSDAGIDENTPGAFKITYIYEGIERTSDLLRPEADWASKVSELLANLQVPISKVLVYEIPNPVPIFEKDLLMRGAD